MVRRYVIIRHYYGTMRTLYDIKTLRGHYKRRKKSRRRVEVNAPPRTRAKIGQGYPLRASERHAGTRPKRADERQERPPASGRREGDTPTPRERAHTSRTAADMYAQGRNACSYATILYIYLYYCLCFL